MTSLKQATAVPVSDAASTHVSKLLIFNEIAQMARRVAGIRTKGDSYGYTSSPAKKAVSACHKCTYRTKESHANSGIRTT